MYVCDENVHGNVLFEYSWLNKEELIHRATRQGRVFSLETYLNQYPVIDINHQYEFGGSRWTLLIVACFYKHENIVRMLLRRFKPDVNGVGDVKLDFVPDTMKGVSPLWVAVAVGHFGIVKLLVEEGNANVNHLSQTRSSPLRAAAYTGCVEIARYLIEHGADMRLARNGNYTNLMLAAYRGHTDLVKYFVDELKWDPNECDQDGRTPLHYAIDSGSVELVKLLLQFGARNVAQNTATPILWAALEGREDLVDVFKGHCSSDLEWIEAREILGASCANMESKHYNLSKAVEHLVLAFQWREEKTLPKPLTSAQPVEAFNYYQECRTLDEFNKISSESNTRLHMESFLIQERILGQKNARFRYAIRFYGAVLADAHQYLPTIQLWLYELELRRQHRINFDKWHLRVFVRVFAEMTVNHFDVIPERALSEVLQALNTELVHGRHNDPNLLTLFYLITIISHVLKERKAASSMAGVYRLLMKIVRASYSTIQSGDRWNLLHLSTLVGSTYVSDNYMTDLCKSPSHRTISLLLQCGANVDAVDSNRNTPLHLIVQRRHDIDNVLSIIDLLCDTGRAHLDCVNSHGQTPLEAASNIRIKTHLRKKVGVGHLMCLCARFIQKNNIFPGNCELPLHLVRFIEKH